MGLFNNLFGSGDNSNYSEIPKSSSKIKIYNIEQYNKEIEKVSGQIIKENTDFIKNALARYTDALIIKKDQLIYKDDYGDYIVNDWLKELHLFIDNKIGEEKEELAYKCVVYMWQRYNLDKVYIHSKEDLLEDFKNDLKYELGTFISDYLYVITIERLELDEEVPIYSDAALSDPIKFENAVAQDFISMGWTARTTTGSGDQGADVIAERDGMKYIVQCKLYSQPVGNKAVQEVISARVYFQGQIAMVVTNSSFTKSAKQLAESSNVLLVHYSILNNVLLKASQISE